MKKILTLIAVSILTLACNLTSAPQPLTVAQNTPTPVVATQALPPPVVDSVTLAPTIAPVTTGTIIYISGTMHFESKANSWPKDVDQFLAFLEATTQAGMRWSIGADVGWLENGERAAEVIQRTSAMGIQWDVHAHAAADRAKVAYLLTQYGVTPTSVVSGMRIDEFDGLLQPLTYQGYTWTPQVVWGGANCVGHKPGCDDPSVALYRPTSAAQYTVHNPNGSLIRVGNTDHQLATAEKLIAQINAGQYSQPVLGFTIMIEPEVLQIANSEDGLSELLAFIEHTKQSPSVRFATIEETAQAWAATGGVPVNFIP